MARQRNTSKRLKGFGIPIEVCVKYERLAGVKPNCKPTKKQSEDVSDLMVKALIVGVANVQLTSEDFRQIAEEVEKNEKHS